MTAEDKTSADLFFREVRTWDDCPRQQEETMRLVMTETLTEFEQEVLLALQQAGEVVESPKELYSVPMQLGFANGDASEVYRALRELCRRGLATARDINNHKSLMSKRGRQHRSHKGWTYRPA